MKDCKNKLKLSNIELLRIIAMFMIVSHHYCVHGIFNFWHINSTLTYYFNNVLVSIIAMGGKLGVDIFVLITGYFMIISKCKFTKAMKIYLVTLVYSLLILITAYIYGEHHVPSKILNQSLFPFGGQAYWFISTYLMLYILVPFLNRFILTTKKTMLNSFLIITTTLWVIIPTFTPANYCFSNLAWFIYLYFVGASIRLKSFGSFFSNKLLFKKFFYISCVILILYAFIKCIGDNINLWNTMKWARMQTIFITSMAIYLFHYFNDLQIHYNRVINFISTSIFGVYLFHDNNIVRPFLWRTIFHPCEMMDKSYMIIYLAIVVIVVFMFSIVFDKVIMMIFDKPINRILLLLQNIDTYKRKILYKKIIKLTGFG